jgi:hypothetical protein
MKGSKRYAGAAACLTALAMIAGCSGEPVDATRQIDDFPLLDKPKDRLKPIAERNFGDKCPKAVIDALVKADPKPEMMALGGSVFNGVSSMQINWWLSEWSPPAQVARALRGGATEGSFPEFFRVPRYPDHGLDPYGRFPNGTPHFRLGLDLETVNLSLIETAFRRQGWVMSDFASYRTTDGRLFNDNVSFGGAAVDDILYGTARDYRARLKAVRHIDTIPPDADKFWANGAQSRTYAEIREHAKRVNGLTDVAKTAGPLKTIFFAENSSFVLNPSGHPCIEEMTPLDQALLRKPTRLLVGVGSNSGLFTFLYAGHPVERVCGDVNFSFGDIVREEKRYVSIRQTSKDDFLTSMKILLDKLATDGKAIENIYVMGQLRPRMIANVKPTSDQGRVGVDADYPPGQVKADPSTYHDQYYLDFAPEGSSRWISDAELKAADDLNDEINAAVNEMVEAHNRKEASRNGSKKRFVFVDLRSLEKYDVKHIADRDVIDKPMSDQPIADRDASKKKAGEKGAPGEPIVITNAHIQGLGDRKVRLDNRVLTFSRTEEWINDEKGGIKLIGQRILQGGIFSVDNLHPTVVGYALLAQELLDSIVRNEPKVQLAPGARESISPQAAYSRHIAGNVLRRLDKGLAAREEWLQMMFDLGAGGGKFDCWRKRGDVR